MEYLHTNETEKIIGIMYKVYNKLGWGLREKHYERSIFLQAKEEGMPCTKQLCTPIYYKNYKIGYNRCDLLFYENVIVELKTGKCLIKRDFNQLNDYLKTFNKKIGLLVLFSPNGVKVRRLANIISK
mgnify:FL=1